MSERTYLDVVLKGGAAQPKVGSDLVLNGATKPPTVVRLARPQQPGPQCGRLMHHGQHSSPHMSTSPCTYSNAVTKRSGGLQGYKGEASS